MRSCFGNGAATNLLFKANRTQRNSNLGLNVRPRTPSRHLVLVYGASPKTHPLDLRDVHWHGLILLVRFLVVAYYRVKQ
jgi:hypothetical protein